MFSTISISYINTLVLALGIAVTLLQVWIAAEPEKYIIGIIGPKSTQTLILEFYNRNKNSLRCVSLYIMIFSNNRVSIYDSEFCDWILYILFIDILPWMLPMYTLKLMHCLRLYINFQYCYSSRLVLMGDFILYLISFFILSYSLWLLTHAIYITLKVTMQQCMNNMSCRTIETHNIRPFPIIISVRKVYMYPNEFGSKGI